MMTLILITYHLILVTAVYWTAYRTGYNACRDESRRLAEAYTTPLSEILEELNLDVDKLMKDKHKDDRR
jgi:hypothetical protein